ncbi:unnamed protein product [Choristocarpus tenellus]
MATVAELCQETLAISWFKSDRVGDGNHPIVQAAVPNTRPLAGGVPVEVGPMEPMMRKNFPERGNSLDAASNRSEASRVSGLSERLGSGTHIVRPTKKRSRTQPPKLLDD